MKYKFSDEINVYYEIHGSGSKPLLLVHGYGASHETWQYVIPLLLNKYKIYVIDLPGFGYSSRPENWDYKFTSFAAVLKSFIEFNNIEGTHAAAHSFGAAPVLWLAAAYPGLLGKIILIDAAINIRKHTLLHFRLRERILKKILIRIIPAKVIAYVSLKRMYFDKKKVTPALVRSYAAYIKLPGSTVSFVKTAEEMYPHIPEQIFPLLQKILSPVFIIWGEKDPLFFCRDAAMLAAEIPNAGYYIIPACGHIPHEENPAAAEELFLKFLN